MSRETIETTEDAFAARSGALSVRRVTTHPSAELPSLPERVLRKLRSARLSSRTTPSAQNGRGKAA